jgi:hypothetical protein
MSKIQAEQRHEAQVEIGTVSHRDARAARGLGHALDEYPCRATSTGMRSA